MMRRSLRTAPERVKLFLLLGASKRNRPVKICTMRSRKSLIVSSLALRPGRDETVDFLVRHRFDPIPPRFGGGAALYLTRIAASPRRRTSFNR